MNERTYLKYLEFERESNEYNIFATKILCQQREIGYNKSEI